MFCSYAVFFFPIHTMQVTKAFSKAHFKETKDRKNRLCKTQTQAKQKL